MGKIKKKITAVLAVNNTRRDYFYVKKIVKNVLVTG